MSFDARAIVKHLGRVNARELTAADAWALFTAMLEGQLDDAAMGAVWMGLRIKGETQGELAVLLAAAESSYVHWEFPNRGALPLVIPSYNGARQLPNLVPLLAGLLARSGVPVLVHGVSVDPARTTTREVFEALGNPPCRNPVEAAERHAAGLPAFVAIETLAPAVARLLDWRWRIGVRSSIHTIAKMLNPCTGPAVRLVSVTHPEYLERMRTFFAADQDGVLLLRGAEGEAVAHPRRALRMERLRAEELVIITAPAAQESGALAGSPLLRAGQPTADAVNRTTPPLPADCSAAATALWIRAALSGTVPIPVAIAAQAAGCIAATRRVEQPRNEVAA